MCVTLSCLLRYVLASLSMQGENAKLQDKIVELQKEVGLHCLVCYYDIICTECMTQGLVLHNEHLMLITC